MRLFCSVEVYHIHDFSQKNPRGFNTLLALLEEWRIEIAEAPVLIFPAIYRSVEILIESLSALAPSLGADMGGS